METFTSIQEAAKPVEVTKVPGATKAGKHQNNRMAKSQIAQADESKMDDDDDEDNWEELDDNELLDEDYDEEEAAEMLAKVVSSDVCLFCSKKSCDIESNVKHMNLMHGFFIPEEQYLIDLEGMMEYLGFKVGAGATCVWCQKQFSSLHGARLHMLSKDHCRIYFDQDKATEEFKDFYDYSCQEQIPMKPLNELAIPKKRSEKYLEHQRALMLKQKESGSRQLIARSNPCTIAGTYQSKNIKKFSAQRAKRLLHIGMQNNNAMRGRLRQQNPI